MTRRNGIYNCYILENGKAYSLYQKSGGYGMYEVKNLESDDKYGFNANYIDTGVTFNNLKEYKEYLNKLESK